jgi:hypothetical protein
VHLRDRARGGDDTGAEPFGEQPGGEPVIAVAVGDEDVSQVPALPGDPVAERTRLVRREWRKPLAGARPASRASG